MGLPTTQMLEPSGVLEELTCAVCLDLVDREDAVQTPSCGHLFCAPCISGCQLSECPTCKTKIPNMGDLRQLQRANPPGNHATKGRHACSSTASMKWPLQRVPVWDIC